MRIVHATHSLNGNTGVETYLIAVADEMQRTGHEVWLYSTELGSSAEQAENLGLRAIGTPEELPDDLDVAFVHGVIASHELAAASPATPQVFIAHGSYFDNYTPPQIDGAVSCVVTLWGRAAERKKGLATNIPIESLTQPVDRTRFRDRAPIGQRARRALILSNYLSGDRLTRVRGGCELAGLAVEHVGATGDGASSRAEDAINRADIVIGKGRVAVEAMSCGRAVYLCDMWGCDGWITPDNYERVAWTGFGGIDTARDPSAEEIAAELGEYDSRLGAWGSSMVVKNNRLDAHAARLIELGAEAAGEGARLGGERKASEELARLARLSWRHEGQAHVHGEYLKQQSQRIDALEAELDASRREAQELVKELDVIRESTSWKLTAPLRRLRSKND
jgi:hypothetical protein